MEVPGDGRLMVASRAYQLSATRWAFEYAVQNVNCHRAVSAFSTPIGSGATVESIGFHDVAYHSGEPFSGADWTAAMSADSSLTWTSEPFTTNPNGNALRWGTVYNFRFESGSPPEDGLATLTLFRPPTPSSPATSVEASIVRPADAFCRADLNHSGTVTIQDCFDFLAAYFAGNAAVADFDRDGQVAIQDIFEFLIAYFSQCP